MTVRTPNTRQSIHQNIPWYRQFWPWFIISIPATAVIGGFIMLFIAIRHPDPVIIDAAEYQQLKNELRAQPAKAEAASDTQQHN